MKRAPMTVLLLAALAALALPAPVARADTDAEALVAEAGRAWDLAAEDAVLLLEEARFDLLPDGRLRETRHRVVWVGSDWASDSFADLRVPWDSDRQTLSVRLLRVRRDGRWIDARPTAVVETTPHALRHAPDHGGLRETMLLHDGVEVPCVLECEYAIEDKAPFRAGIEGEWVFARSVPALVSRVRLAAPAAVGLRAWAAPGAPEPVADGDGRVWELRRVPPLPQPAGDDPGADLPRLAWSTFADWAALGRAVREACAPGLALDAALRDSLAARLDGALAGDEKVRRVLAFVHDGCARLNYAWRPLLPRVRAAARVWDTAYGADPELVMLAGALLREAGFAVEPAFVARLPGHDPCEVPTLARFGAPGLWIEGDEVAGWWDPASGGLRTEGAPLTGRLVWRAGGDEPPRLHGGGVGSAAIASVDLKWDAKERAWSGEGLLRAYNAFSPRDALAEGPEAAQRRLDALAGGLLPGLAVAGLAPATVAPERVSLRLKTKPAPAARDSLGRVVVAIGAPAGGLAELLPADGGVAWTAREAPLRLPGPLAQVVRVSLAHGPLAIVRAPQARTLANAAGRFDLQVERRDGRLVVTRTLELAKGRYEPAEWPAVRELLLADADAAARTVLLKE